MCEIVIKFLLAEDKSMNEMHLRRSGLTVLMKHLLKTKNTKI